MKRLLFSFLAVVLCTNLVFADIPFRLHRSSVFNILPVNHQSIVFIGNSITQGCEWWEAFDNPNILNRGISGALSGEVVDNLTSFISGKPKKVFLMIGTNDLAQPEIVIPNITKIVDRIQNESPNTEIYIQSILPTNKEERNGQILCTNFLIEQLCHEKQIQYIDLWSQFILPHTATLDPQYSNDGLHLLGSGYRKWCNYIAPLVGSTPVFPDDATNNLIPNTTYPGQRASQFAMLPIKNGDIIMAGDVFMNTGEWHELFNDTKIKNRGIGVGYPPYSIDLFTQAMPMILSGREDNGKPAKIFLQAGTGEAIWGTDMNQIINKYQSLIETIKQTSPTTQIYIQSLLPHHTKKMNEERFIPLNIELEKLAQKNGAIYIDLFKPFVVEQGVCNPDYFEKMYLYGKGYQYLVELLKPYIQ